MRLLKLNGIALDAQRRRSRSVFQDYTAALQGRHETDDFPHGLLKVDLADFKWRPFQHAAKTADELARPLVVTPDIGGISRNSSRSGEGDFNISSAVSALVRMKPSGWFSSCAIYVVNSPAAE
jgi:hypothetical protein